MKKNRIIIVIVFVLLPLLANAQFTQRGFNFQGIARDLEGKAISNENVEIKFTIYPDGGGTSWSEEQTLTTDGFGVFTAIIGSNQPNSFKNIDFSSDRYFIKVEVKVSGSYQLLSDTELLGVPYSKTADRAHTADYAVTGFFPAGIIVPFGGSDGQTPGGWLLCDGQGLKSSEYPALYTAIGTAWGNGSENCPGGGCNFNAPDLRGVFVRGVDGTRGQDPDKSGRTAIHAGGSTGNAVGSYQADANQYHTHNYVDYYYNDWSHGGDVENNEGADGDGTNTYKWTKATTANGATDARPRNAYVNYIIKY
jgi:hypothetical protein